MTHLLLTLLVAACGSPREVDRDLGVVDTVVVAAPDPIQLYLRAPLPSADSFALALSMLERAGAMVEERRHGSAAALLDSALALVPTMRDWRPLILADVHARAGDTARTRMLLEQVDRRTGLVERWGWDVTSRALENAGRPTAARLVAETRAREAAGEESGRAWLRVGRLALAEGDTGRARAAFLHALEGEAGSPPAVQAALRLADLPGVSPGDRHRAGGLLLQAGEWEGAHAALRSSVVGLEATEEERDRVRLGMARALMALERYRDAEIEVRSVVQSARLPRGEQAEALLLLASIQEGRGLAGDAAGTLRRVAGLFGDQPPAGRAFLRLSAMAEAAGREAEAREHLSLAIEHGLRSGDAYQAALRLGSRAYLGEEYELAARIFDGYREGEGDAPGRQQAAYWAALAHRRLGNREAARERFLAAFTADPVSYYGQLAAEEVEEALLPVDLPAGPETPPGLEHELENALIRLKVHLEVPTPGSFLFETERLKRYFSRPPGGVYALAETMIEGGWPMRGVLLGREILREEGDWNLRLLRIVYPFPHRELVAREAERRGVNPFFAAAMIRQESMFEAGAVSSAGAIGLMQVMPGTGRQVARSLGMGSVSAGDLQDPETNVVLGMAYLAEMIRRFDGRVPDILSAYNAGPSRIRRWRQMPAYRDRDVFVESIPFRETRNHVKIVELNLRIYTALYGCGDFQPCPGMSYRSYLAERGGGAATASRRAR